MIGTAALRVLRGALRNFWRNIWLSLATTMIMTMTLLIVLFLYFANVFGAEALKSIQQKFDLTLEFRSGVTQEQINQVARTVEARSDVASMQIVTSEEAAEIFRRNNADNPLIAESLELLDENPLPATMYIVATDPKYYRAIANELSGGGVSEAVAAVRYEDTREAIDKLIVLIDSVKNVGLVVTIIFVVLVVLIMFNTVRLAIYSFREEIDIMHLVGASGWFIRGPFVLEAVLVSLIAVVLATLVMYPLLRYAAGPPSNFFFTGIVLQTPFDLYRYATEHWLQLLMLQVAVAIGLATISSLIALQRYLRA